MLNNLWLLLWFCITVVTQNAICLLVEKNTKCHPKSNDKHYRLFVKHGQPLTVNNNHGMTFINSSLVRTRRGTTTGRYTGTSCAWSLRDGQKRQIAVKECTDGSINSYNTTWHFLKPGLHEVEVTVTFNLRRTELRNCTLVNVTDCSRQVNLVVSTSKGSFNTSKNNTNVDLVSPGVVNVSVKDITDPFYVCHPFYYTWRFGDGQNFSRESKISQFYNSTGLFHMILSIFNGRNFFKNVSLTVHVKGTPSTDDISKTTIDITLILAIFFACLILVVCLGMMFRRRLHRSTEVASFDFRGEDCQSINTDIYYEQGCFSKFKCNRNWESHQLLSIEDYASFGTMPPNENL